MTRYGEAGASALREAQRAKLRVDEYARRLRTERQRVSSFTVAGSSERQVATRLAAMDDWHLLADRQWPGSDANIDMIHVGPGGVLVIDVKAWESARVVGDRLFRGDTETDAIEKLSVVTRLVQEVLEFLYLAPLEVLPVIVFTGPTHPLRTADPRRVGCAQLEHESTSCPGRFAAARVSRQST